jgi:hypothetical protein
LHKDSIFSDSITAIKLKEYNTLYSIMGLLSSNFFKYYILQQGSSIGIEREQIHNPEKFSLPYIQTENIIKIVKELENYSKNEFAQYGGKFNKLKEKLNKTILEAFTLSNQEYALVDYATNIIIPWVIQKNYDVAFSHYDFKDSKIEEYVKIFTQHYNRLYEHLEFYFQVTIYWSKYAIAIYFKTLKQKPTNQVEWKKEETLNNFLQLMKGQTLENLFIQQDIKGFEENGFYVVKPNEIKNWHKAIGYLDFYEFKDAILKAGQKKWKNLKA